MELMLTYPQKHSGVILNALASLGYTCQEPIPFDMNDVSPNALLCVQGHSARDADATLVMSEADRLCSEPWFDKKTMQMHIEGSACSWCHMPPLQHQG